MQTFIAGPDPALLCSRSSFYSEEIFGFQVALLPPWDYGGINQILKTHDALKLGAVPPEPHLTFSPSSLLLFRVGDQVKFYSLPYTKESDLFFPFLVVDWGIYLMCQAPKTQYFDRAEGV